MVHMMRYNRETRTVPLILSTKGNGSLKLWVDALFDVHPNMRGYAGGGFSLERKFPILSSTKQKLNTRRSTDTELVGADDFMTVICCTNYFLKAQGYRILENVLF